MRAAERARGTKGYRHGMALMFEERAAYVRHAHPAVFQENTYRAIADKLEAQYDQRRADRETEATSRETAGRRTTTGEKDEGVA